MSKTNIYYKVRIVGSDSIKEGDQEVCRVIWDTEKDIDKMPAGESKAFEYLNLAHVMFKCDMEEGLDVIFKKIKKTCPTFFTIELPSKMKKSPDVFAIASELLDFLNKNGEKL